MQKYKTVVVFLSIIVMALSSFLISCNSENNKFQLFEKQEEVFFSKKIDSIFDTLTHYYNVNPDSAILMAEKLELQFSEDGEYNAQIRLYGFLSELYQYRIQDDNRALEYIILALNQQVQQPNYFYDNPYLFINAGNILYRYGLVEEAIYVYSEIQEIQKIAHVDIKPEVLVLINNNIGLSYQSLGKCDSANYYFHQASNYVESCGNRKVILKIQNLNYQGKLAIQCENNDSLPYFYGETEVLFNSIDDILGKYHSAYLDKWWGDISIQYYLNKISSSGMMAQFYLLEGDYMKAIEYYQQAGRFSDLAEDGYSHVILNRGIAECYYQMDSIDLCLLYLDTAYNRSTNSRIGYNNKVEILNLKSLCFESKGLTAEADTLKLLAEMYIDSINLGLNTQDIIAQKIELAVKPVQLALKNIEIREYEKTKTIEMQNLIIKFLIALLVLVILSVVVYMRFLKNLKNARLELANRTIESLKATGNAQEKDVLADKIERELLEKFEKMVVGEKEYLMNNLSLNDLALKLETNRSYISKLINNVYGINFNEYINKLRIKEACRIIFENTNPNFTIDHLFSEVGFTGKSTFYTAFKKYTGVTPAVFFKMNSKAESSN